MSAWRKVLLILFSAVFIVSAASLGRILLGYREAEKTYEAMDRQAYFSPTPETAPDEKPTENAPDAQSADETAAEPSDGEPAPETPFIFDLSALQSDFPDAVGWITLPDSPIDYPVMKGKSNESYLRRLPDGTANSAGSIFMDERCDRDLADRNTILYGHHMRNGSMFAALTKYKDADFAKSHPQLTLYASCGRFALKPILGLTVTADDQIYSLLNDGQGLSDYIASRKRSSCIRYDADGCPEKLVTLSTCAYDFDNARFVLICAAEKQ